MRYLCNALYPISQINSIYPQIIQLTTLNFLVSLPNTQTAERTVPLTTSPCLCVCQVTWCNYWPCRSGWRRPETRSTVPGWCPWRLVSRSGSRFHWWCEQWWWGAAPSPRGCAAPEKTSRKKEVFFVFFLPLAGWKKHHFESAQRRRWPWLYYKQIMHNLEPFNHLRWKLTF